MSTNKFTEEYEELTGLLGGGKKKTKTKKLENLDSQTNSTLTRALVCQDGCCPASHHEQLQTQEAARAAAV